MKAFSARVVAWQQRVDAFNSVNPTGMQGERQREALNKERLEIEKQRAELEAERTRMTTGSAEAVRAYNAKAGALDARVGDWNQRNARWNEMSTALETDRQTWAASCADRRYREEDENAIKAGK